MGRSRATKRRRGSNGEIMKREMWRCSPHRSMVASFTSYSYPLVRQRSIQKHGTQRQRSSSPILAQADARGVPLQFEATPPSLSCRSNPAPPPSPASSWSPATAAPDVCCCSPPFPSSFAVAPDAESRSRPHSSARGPPAEAGSRSCSSRPATRGSPSRANPEQAVETGSPAKRLATAACARAMGRRGGGRGEAVEE